MGSGIVLTLLGKPDCPLCHEMRGVVAEVLQGRAHVVERDVRSDPELERRYRFEIPVLFLGDQEIARHIVSPSELKARLARLGVIPER